MDVGNNCRHSLYHKRLKPDNTLKKQAMFFSGEKPIMVLPFSSLEFCTFASQYLPLNLIYV